jgi:hypothetical protein
MANEFETLIPADAADLADKLAFALQSRRTIASALTTLIALWRGSPRNALSSTCKCQAMS